MPQDRILDAFLRRQFEEAMALTRESDLVELVPVGPHPPRRYVARFRCTGLCRLETGEVAEMHHAEVGIFLPDDYLRRTDPYQILVWLGPRNVWHPNISDKAPIVCLGRLGPGTRLVDILYQLFEIISFKRYTTHDALNLDAAAWTRQHQHRLPADPRPLKRRRLPLKVQQVTAPCGCDTAGSARGDAGCDAGQATPGAPAGGEGCS